MHPHQLYALCTPNVVKVTIMLEELLEAGHQQAEYDAWLIRIGEGEQFSSGFVDIKPNSKIPAMLDQSIQPNRRIFESCSIILSLSSQFSRLVHLSCDGLAACHQCLLTNCIAATHH